MGMSDRQVRVFKFATGKMIRKYDETLETISEMQQVGGLGVPIPCGVLICVEHRRVQPFIVLTIWNLVDDWQWIASWSKVHKQHN